VAEPLSNEAHALFAHLADDPPAQLLVPDLFYIECTNILWKYTRRLGLPPGDARLFIERLGQLAITAYSTASLMADALDIAMEHGLTAYDAAYVALARQLSLPRHRRRSLGGCSGRDQGRHPAAGRVGAVMVGICGHRHGFGHEFGETYSQRAQR
jgi:predicted nucleic acid-binding protein